MGKIVTKDDFVIIRKALKKDNKKIVLCHGVFDLVHPGHIIHFEEAKSFGDILVVSITSAKYVRKGPGRPYFNDELRLKFLSSIETIDYVILSESYTVNDIVESVEPDLYVKGQEYSDSEKDITGKIDEEAELVRKHGGNVCFTNGQTFSSTRLINNCLPSLSHDVKMFMHNTIKKYSFDSIQKYLDELRNVKVLVIGDAIIDNYTFCDMQGLMSKDRGFSVRYKGEKQFLGGALAIARHASQFSEKVTIATIIGNENEIHSKILNDLGKDMRISIEYSSQFPTIVKKRFVVVNEKREEFDKIFSVNNIPKELNGEEKSVFIKRVHDIINEYDVVLLCDFGHGLIDEELMKIIQEKAKFLALNCQTNSANYGMNLITKYNRADAFVLDQRELRLAYHDNTSDEILILERLLKHLGGRYGWLTQAAHGATGISSEAEQCSCPALTLDVKDTVGAGDAFFVSACMCSALQIPLEISTFLGNISGALASNILGNEKPVEKVNILKYANTLMNL